MTIHSASSSPARVRASCSIDAAEGAFEIHCRPMSMHAFSESDASKSESKSESDTMHASESESESGSLRAVQG